MSSVYPIVVIANRRRLFINMLSGTGSPVSFSSDSNCCLNKMAI